MCGIVGFTSSRNSELLHEMIQSMVHRGPDDEGRYESDEVSFGFRRLSIVDLSSGNQPLFNETHSVCVVFNGEIYNFKEIKESLIQKGHRFISSTDGEIIPHAYEEYGIECVQKFRGMFAFALWDKEKQILFLVRDRLGIKPLHYTRVNTTLLFASEIKSLLRSPFVKPELNPEAMNHFLSFRYVPGTESLLKNIHILEPGHYLKFHKGNVSIHPYWQLTMEAKDLKMTEEEGVETFKILLEESVKYRLMSDVPLGVYLSGGLDSSIVAGLVQKFHPKTITFSHGFDGHRDELKYARRVAKHLGSEHEEVMIQKKDIHCLPEIIYHMDSPIANSDIIGFYLLAKLARPKVKVILAGEGADELFGSYVHQEALFYGHTMKKYFPSFLWKKFLPFMLKKVPLSYLNVLFAYPGYSLDQKSRDKILRYFDSSTLTDDYLTLNSLFSLEDKRELYEESLAKKVFQPSTLHDSFREILEDSSIHDTLNRLIKLEFQYWLPSYHLMKEDKIAMSQGLEQRYPFLDHFLVEYMACVPSHLKLKRRTRKYLLRKAFKDLLPSEIIHRPKGPILVPIDHCFGNEFDALLSDCLSEKRVKERGLFKYSTIQKLRAERGQNPFLYDRQLFALLVFELWCEIFLDKKGRV